MTTASEINLPKWQEGRGGCQNGRLSKSCAKHPANMAKKFGMVFAYANLVPKINIFCGMIFAHSRKLFPNTILT